MIRRPPRSTRTHTLFPDPPRFRSAGGRPFPGDIYVQRPIRNGDSTDRDECADRACRRLAQSIARRHSIRAYRASLASARHERRSEEHTSELQSLMRISYAVFCLKKTKTLL